MPTVTYISPTGDLYVNGVLIGVKWGVSEFTYSFPTNPSFYGPGYSSGEAANGFEAFNSVQQDATRSALAMYSAVANVTFTEITETSTQHADLRYAESSSPSTAWAYYPTTSDAGGDAWFNHSYYNNPVAGTYAWYAIIHETGHAMGLKHPHTAIGGFNAMPIDHDSMEYSVMSYRSYVGASMSSLSNDAYGYPQTLMMYDIAALQVLYGANYTSNAGDTTYTWDPNTGQGFINGVGQAVPGANKIFMTLWDGGGCDTYDFSNYTTNLTVDLRPGAWTTTSTAQLANLGNGHYAAGNIANALLYQGNTASLIENAIGGSGNDTIIGNDAHNWLTGGGGNDILDGGAGIDTAVFFGLSASYRLVSNADGTWTVTDLRVGSPDGTDLLRSIELFQFSDCLMAAGEVPPPVIQPPAITSYSADSGIVGDGITNDSTLTLTGAAAANSTVKIYDGETLVGTVTASASGVWTFTTGVLADGHHGFAATAADGSGNTSAASVVLNITVDTICPDAPNIVSFSSDTGVLGDHVTHDNTLTINGMAAANSTVHVYDGAALLGVTTADANGAWSLAAADPAAPALCACPTCAANRDESADANMATLADGVHSFTATATDAAGNVSAASAALAVTVDTVAPAAPAILAYTHDSGVAGDGITSDSTLTLTGTAAANSSVKVYDGATLLGSVSADAGGVWSLTTAALADGGHSFTATATDAAGNVSAASAALAVTVDTVAPAAPAILAYSTDSGVAGDGITSDTTLTLTGTAAANSSVKVYDGATLLGSASADAGGVWSLTTAALADGGHSFTATATDAAGNVSAASAALAVTVDTVAPAAPAILAYSTDSGVAGDGITSDTTLTLTGTAAANSSVKVYDGATLLGSVSADASGVWSLTTAALADGGHSFTATATDAAGNVSAASAALAVTVDTVAPAAPAILAYSTDSGIAGDGITSDTTLTLTGTAAANSSVKVYDGATLLGSASADAGGVWSLTTAALADGGHSFTATATDAAGNVSAASAALAVTVDTVAPAAPAILAYSTDSGVAGDGITSDTTLTLTGTAAANSSVKVYDGATLLGITIAGAAGVWSFPTTTLSDGAHNFTATATDAAGNTSSASAVLTVTIDTPAPVAPTLIVSSNDGGNIGDGITNDNTLIVTGVAPFNSTVKIYDGATMLGTAAADAAGNWTFTTAALADGSHSFTATATDAAGNVSAASAAFNVTVDTVAPGAPVIRSFSTYNGTVTDQIAADSTFMLSGTAAADSAVRVYDRGNLLGTTTADAGGEWNYPILTLTEGGHQFTAIAIDTAGNTSATSNVVLGWIGGTGNDWLLAGAGDDVLHGGSGDDWLDGGAGADTLCGDEGNDWLSGGAGDDLIYGGSGNDGLDGGAGADTLYGDEGNDWLSGGAGDDLIYGGEGDDGLDGGAGADTLYGGEGNDWLSGGADNDVLHGGAGNDWLDGGAGADTLYGDEGNDWFAGGDGNDVLHGGAGDDWLDGGAGADLMVGGAGNDIYTVDDVGDQIIENADEGIDLVNASVSFTLSENLENLTLTGVADIAGVGNALANGITGNAGANVLIGGAGDDYLFGNAGADTLYGDEGNDWLSGGDDDDLIYGGSGNDGLDGGAGADTLYGDEGNDWLSGGAGADALHGGAGDDCLDGGAGADTLYGGEGNDWLSGGADNDVLHGGAGNDWLDGGAGADTLYGDEGNDWFAGGDGNDVLHGGAGDDWLDGGAGADLMVGGAGNDIYTVDDVGDQIIENADEGIDLVNASVSFTLSENLENLTLTGVADIAGVGNALANGITGNAGANVLIGGAGDDYLFGNAGADTLYGDEGNDWLSGGDDDDLIYGGSGNDGLDGGAGADTLYGDEGNDWLSGGAGADALHGGAGDDCLDGGAGADTLYGGEGNDWLSGGADNDVLHGGAGNDWLDGGAGADTLYGDEGNDWFAGGDGNDVLHGGAGDDWLDGGAGADTLYGGEGNDWLFGGADNDVLCGGGGNDYLEGGAGADVFVFDDSSIAPGSTCLITDFTSGEDLIDLSGIDANALSPENDAFRFLGTDGFVGQAGELRYSYNAGRGVTVIEGDVNGDGVADFSIDLSGHKTLQVADFSVGTMLL